MTDEEAARREALRREQEAIAKRQTEIEAQAAKERAEYERRAAERNREKQ